jgi:serine/threonine protein kinase
MGHFRRYVTRVVILTALTQTSKFSALTNSKTFARKLIRPWAGISQADIDNEVRAINKLCKTNHPNIVQVLGYGQLKADGVFYFIDMELCETSLEKYIQGETINDLINWNTVRNRNEVHEHAYIIMQQILNGMIYIHCLSEVHRDLSPNNGTSFSDSILT